ncbi:MAG TPA: alpha/beta family hydrolase [Kofleriaceae bacterium]|nr:alpha/beta family hydrolase [Kofleriaceae bacterium]
MAGRALELASHAALVDRPRGATALLVLAHGAGAGMRHPFMAELAGELAARRIATVRWEFRYMTAGKRRVDPPEVAEASVAAVWAEVRRRYPRLPAFAGGKSFGGRMTSRAHAAAALPGLRGLIFVGFPLHPAGRPGTERAEHLSRAAGPMLFVQGTRDALCDLALLRPVVRGLGPRATLVTIDRADHGLDRSGAIAELGENIASWIADRL